MPYHDEGMWLPAEYAEPDELPSKAPVWVMAEALFWLIVGVAVGKVL